MCSETQATSGYLNHEPRTEAQALADRISKNYQMDMGRVMIPVTHDQFDLIIRALRAYKPAPVTDTHHEFDGGEG